MTAKLLQATAVALALSLSAPAAMAQAGGGGGGGGGGAGGGGGIGGSGAGGVGSRSGSAPGLQGSGSTVGRPSHAIQPNTQPGSGLTGGANGLTSSDTTGSGTSGLGNGAATLPRSVLDGGISGSGLGGPAAGATLGAGAAPGAGPAGTPAGAPPLPADRGTTGGATDGSGLGRTPATDTSRVDRGTVGTTGSASPERSVLNGGTVGSDAESTVRGTPLGTGGAAGAAGTAGTSAGGTLGRTTLRSGSSTNPNDGTSDPVPPSSGSAGSSLVPPRDRAAPPTQSPLDCGGSFGRCGSPSRRDATTGAGSATIPR